MLFFSILLFLFRTRPALRCWTRDFYATWNPNIVQNTARAGCGGGENGCCYGGNSDGGCGGISSGGGGDDGFGGGSDSDSGHAM